MLAECAEKARTSSYEVVPMIPETALGLRGAHQRINASLAVALARGFLRAQGKEGMDDALPRSFVAPLAGTKWPGRCQRVEQGKTTWLLDGAHTTESLTSCGEWAWGEGNKPGVLIFNCSGGRAGQMLLTALLEAGARTSSSELVELGKRFEAVIFCTNVTYTDGHFSSGE